MAQTRVTMEPDGYRAQMTRSLHKRFLQACVRLARLAPLRNRGALPPPVLLRPAEPPDHKRTLERKQAEQAAKPSQAACSPRGWVGDAVEGRRDDERCGADPHHDVEVIVRLLERRRVHVHIRRRRLHRSRATSSELRSPDERECGLYLEDLCEDTGSEYGGDGEPGVAHCKRSLRILLAVPARTPPSAH